FFIGNRLLGSQVPNTRPGAPFDCSQPLPIRRDRASRLVHLRRFLPVEVAAEDGFDDPAIGAGSRTYAYSDVDFPFGRDIEVGDYKDLLLLIVERIEGAQAAG